MSFFHTNLLFFFPEFAEIRELTRQSVAFMMLFLSLNSQGSALLAAFLVVALLS